MKYHQIWHMDIWSFRHLDTICAHPWRSSLMRYFEFVTKKDLRVHNFWCENVTGISALTNLSSPQRTGFLNNILSFFSSSSLIFSAAFFPDSINKWNNNDFLPCMLALRPFSYIFCCFWLLLVFFRRFSLLFGPFLSALKKVLFWRNTFYEVLPYLKCLWLHYIKMRLMLLKTK